MLNSVVLLGKACSIVDAKHKPSSPSINDDDFKPANLIGTQKPREEDRRRSDPCVDSKYSSQSTSQTQQILKKNMKRSKSLSGKMDATGYSHHTANNVTSIPENELARMSSTMTGNAVAGGASGSSNGVVDLPDSPLTPKLLFENSTVNLQSVGLETDLEKHVQEISSGSQDSESGIAVITSENLLNNNPKVRHRKLQHVNCDVDR